MDPNFFDEMVLIEEKLANFNKGPIMKPHATQFDEWTELMQKGQLPEKKHYHVICKSSFFNFHYLFFFFFFF